MSTKRIPDDEKQNNGEEKVWGYMLRHPKQGGSNLRVAIRVGPKALDKIAGPDEKDG